MTEIRSTAVGEEHPPTEPARHEAELENQVDAHRRMRSGHPLVRYLAFRVALGVGLVFGVVFITFVLTNLVPADPVQAALGEQAAANPEIVAQVRRDMGLDKPLPEQFVIYVTNVLHADLGVSVQTRNPVTEDLTRAFPATVELASVAIVFSTLIGIALGMLAAIRRGRLTDHVIRVISLAGISVPTFWLALLSFYLFSYKLAMLPGSGRLSPTAAPPPRVTGMYTVDAIVAGQWSTLRDALQHLVLPAAVLALFTIGLMTRFARSAVLEVLNMDYVRAARAKGLPTRIVLMRYVLRGALVPIITVVGIAFGSLLSGAVLAEEIFSWQGIGQYAYNGAVNLDLPAVMGVGLLIGVVYICVNLLVDILYGLVDPRVRRQ